MAELAAAQTLFDKYGGAAAVDPYMTLVGYFNSLRELGGMRRLVEDDVASRLGQIDAHGLAKRRRPEVQELTSRLGSSGIPRVLDQLQVPFRSGIGDRDLFVAAGRRTGDRGAAVAASAAASTGCGHQHERGRHRCRQGAVPASPCHGCPSFLRGAVCRPA